MSESSASSSSGVELEAAPFSVSVRRVLTWQLIAVGAIVVVGALVGVAARESGGLGILNSIVDPSLESSVPTWFSQTNLAVLAILLALAGAHARRRQDRDWRSWMLLAIVALYLSVDEGAMLHDRLQLVIGDDASGSGFLTWWWVVPFGLIALSVVALSFRFWRRLPAPTQRRLAAAAALYVVGAIGMEMITAEIAAGADGVGRLGGASGYPFFFGTIVEESAEMLGVVVAVYAVLDHIRTTTSRGATTIDLVA